MLLTYRDSKLNFGSTIFMNRLRPGFSNKLNGIAASTIKSSLIDLESCSCRLWCELYLFPDEYESIVVWPVEMSFFFHSVYNLNLYNKTLNCITIVNRIEYYQRRNNKSYHRTQIISCTCISYHDCETTHPTFTLILEI